MNADNPTDIGNPRNQQRARNLVGKYRKERNNVKKDKLEKALEGRGDINPRTDRWAIWYAEKLLRRVDLYLETEGTPTRQSLQWIVARAEERPKLLTTRQGGIASLRKRLQSQHDVLFGIVKEMLEALPPVTPGKKEYYLGYDPTGREYIESLPRVAPGDDSIKFISKLPSVPSLSNRSSQVQMSEVTTILLAVGPHGKRPEDCVGAGTLQLSMIEPTESGPDGDYRSRIEYVKRGKTLSKIDLPSTTSQSIDWDEFAGAIKSFLSHVPNHLITALSKALSDEITITSAQEKEELEWLVPVLTDAQTVLRNSEQSTG